jgi:hypothetical protein
LSKATVPDIEMSIFINAWTAGTELSTENIERACARVCNISLAAGYKINYNKKGAK